MASDPVLMAEAPNPVHPSSRRGRSPNQHGKTSEDQIPEESFGFQEPSIKPFHSRSSSVVKISDLMPSSPLACKAQMSEEPEGLRGPVKEFEPTHHSSGAGQEEVASSTPTREPRNPRFDADISPRNITHTDPSHPSVTEPPVETYSNETDNLEQHTDVLGLTQGALNALDYLDPTSPEITPERIRESLVIASDGSPHSSNSSSPSSHSTSSISSTFRDDASSVTTADNGSERGASPPRDINLEQRTSTPGKHRPYIYTTNHRQRSYGTPEMPRGNANYPHLSPEALTPRIPDPGYAKRHSLPRAEKLPLTGYELLASRISSSGDQNGPLVKPLYRRFETLNHRLLLHLQDELSELEEQLHRLDTADTQNRRMQNCILPASRRTEYLAGGELQWHRTDILGRIGFKLEQYNRVLSSFATAQHLPTPSLADIHEYRGFLAVHGPIAEIETRFLDATDDLVCLGADQDSDSVDYGREDAMDTPMPRAEFPSPTLQQLPEELVKPKDGALEVGTRQLQNDALPPAHLISIAALMVLTLSIAVIMR